MESFADTVSLWMPYFGFCVLNVIESEVKLVVMAVSLTSIFRASVGQYTKDRQLMACIKWQYAVV